MRTRRIQPPSGSLPSSTRTRSSVAFVGLGHPLRIDTHPWWTRDLFRVVEVDSRSTLNSLASGAMTGSDQRGCIAETPSRHGWRAVSILLVLACHWLPMPPKALYLNHAAGAAGMALFFALSDFLLVSWRAGWGVHAQAGGADRSAGVADRSVSADLAGP